MSPEERTQFDNAHADARRAERQRIMGQARELNIDPTQQILTELDLATGRADVAAEFHAAVQNTAAATLGRRRAQEAQTCTWEAFEPAGGASRPQLRRCRGWPWCARHWICSSLAVAGRASRCALRSQTASVARAWLEVATRRVQPASRMP